jgi:hypothetical protein
VLLEKAIQTGTRKSRHLVGLLDITSGIGYELRQVSLLRLEHSGLPVLLEGG